MKLQVLYSLHHNHLTQASGWYVPETLSQNGSQHAFPLRASVIAFTFTPAQSGTPFYFSQENSSAVCTGSDLGPEKEGDKLRTPKTYHQESCYTQIVNPSWRFKTCIVLETDYVVIMVWKLQKPSGRRRQEWIHMSWLFLWLHLWLQLNRILTNIVTVISNRFPESLTALKYVLKFEVAKNISRVEELALVVVVTVVDRVELFSGVWTQCDPDVGCPLLRLHNLRMKY